MCFEQSLTGFEQAPSNRPHAPVYNHPVKGKRKSKRGRYGSGSLWLRHRIWWVKWREVKRSPDGIVQYIQHAESTHSEDAKYAEKFLRRKLVETGGRRPTLVDPQKVSYEDLRENFLIRCVERKRRSLKRDKAGAITLATLPRLDRFFGTWRAAEISTGDIRRFRIEGNQNGLSDARLNRYVATLRAMFRRQRGMNSLPQPKCLL